MTKFSTIHTTLERERMRERERERERFSSPGSLALSAPWMNTGTFADGIDQDQTAQNVQSDL